MVRTYGLTHIALAVRDPQRSLEFYQKVVRLVDPTDIDAAVTAVERAGGTVIERGDFIPGEPYVFFRDPDGYVVEIWYELTTSVDPR